jgi:hypothetical protein
LRLGRTGPTNHSAKFFDLRPLIHCNFAIYLITEMANLVAAERIVPGNRGA